MNKVVIAFRPTNESKEFMEYLDNNNLRYDYTEGLESRVKNNRTAGCQFSLDEMVIYDKITDTKFINFIDNNPHPYYKK